MYDKSFPIRAISLGNGVDHKSRALSNNILKIQIYDRGNSNSSNDDIGHAR